MALDATIGASQNSYVSLVDANTYHNERLHNAEWDDASNEHKEAALIWATTTLDNTYQWIGSIADSTNALRWPRTNVYDMDGELLASDAIPEFLEDATSDLALELLKKDIFQNDDSFNIRKVSAGAVGVSFIGEKASTIPRQVSRMVNFFTTHMGGNGGGNMAFLNKA